jgi:predicted CopG family antitoxin
MPKRTTLVLSDRVYEKLVSESMKKYGSARNLSKVVNDLVEEKTESKSDIMELIYSEKLTKTSTRDFEQFRRKLSNSLEQR